MPFEDLLTFLCSLRTVNRGGLETDAIINLKEQFLFFGQKRTFSRFDSSVPRGALQADAYRSAAEFRARTCTRRFLA